MSIDSQVDFIKQKLNEELKTTVSVALFGQPGAGKSSLINKIVGRKVAEPGVETDKTVDAACYEARGLKFWDLPGYGTKNFPKETYFEKFNVKEFDLFLCVTSGKFHQADTEFFQELKQREKVCIFIVNKHDELWEDDFTTEQLEQRKREDIYKQVGQNVAVIFTSCRKNYGLDVLTEEIENNLDDAKKERWARGAKAYSLKFLQEKKAACEKYVSYACAAATANAINPIPGADIAVDISIILKLFKEIRDDYGLSDSSLNVLEESTVPAVSQMANYVMKYATQEGIFLILKNFARATTIKEVSKYIPFVGQLVAAGLGYMIVSNAGESYLNKCHELAEAILTNNLKV
jgi:small GTP-binding protein